MIALRLIALCLFLPLAAMADGASQPLHPIIAILPKGQLNKPYPSLTLVAGGTPPYTSQIAGSLPQGMSLSGTGLLVGTPRATGAFRFTLDVTDSAGATLALSYVLQVDVVQAPPRNTLLGPAH
ncbi:MAG TPA: Ig domain-containing protein [Magnetospirillaceae bacterium]|nr:Ig domain-containing protein [Magnetospirillaceae bacterium]